jgi:hypothetical protein
MVKRNDEKIANIASWFTVYGFIENIIKLAIRREKAKKEKREKAIKKLQAISADHVQKIREFTGKLIEHQEKKAQGNADG